MRKLPELSRLIRRWRKEAKMSIEQLSEMMNCSYAKYRRFELAQSEFPLSELKMLLVFILGCGSNKSEIIQRTWIKNLDDEDIELLKENELKVFELINEEINRRVKRGSKLSAHISNDRRK